LKRLALVQTLLDLAFRGTTSRLGGYPWQIGPGDQQLPSAGFPGADLKRLQHMGFVQGRPNGEYHMNNPAMTKLLHKALEDRQYDHYEVYKAQLENRPPTALRDLLDFTERSRVHSIGEVESVESIMERFCTGGMSLGALSREAHEVLAIAMNRIGGKSNSGEGGEDPRPLQGAGPMWMAKAAPPLSHLRGLRNGDTASSAIKQVASGRFGVTPEYLMHARKLRSRWPRGPSPVKGASCPAKR
jgi:glutamate synthase (ferredoxin)